MGDFASDRAYIFSEQTNCPTAVDILDWQVILNFRDRFPKETQKGIA
jgi:hypothetical protein